MEYNAFVTLLTFLARVPGCKKRKRGNGPLSKPKKKTQALKLALVVLAVVLLAACGTLWYMYSQVAPALDEGEAGQLNQVKDPDLEAEGDRTYNLLLLGIDYDTDRDYGEGKGMTDVILYVQIDRDAGTVNAFQIPRDAY